MTVRINTGGLNDIVYTEDNIQELSKTEKKEIAKAYKDAEIRKSIERDKQELENESKKGSDDRIYIYITIALIITFILLYFFYK